MNLYFSRLAIDLAMDLAMDLAIDLDLDLDLDLAIDLPMAPSGTGMASPPGFGAPIRIARR
jgi:hypothetical protein